MTDSAESSAPAPEPPATLGELLRSARLAQDLTVEQLSTDLRIEAKQLTALEQNRFEQIGVPVFIKGYLKQYGMRLGLNVSDLLALYYKQTTLADVQIQPNRTIKLRDERQIASWVVATIVLLVVIGGLGIWWWSGGTFEIPSLRQSAPAAPPAPATDEAEPSAPPAPTPAPGATTPERLPTVDPPPAPLVPPEGREGAPLAVPAVAAAEPENDSLAAPVVSIPLQFEFGQESWAEVTDGRGERLLFGLNAAGRNVTVRGEPPFAIVLGNADSVRLTVDGEPYPIPTVGRQGNLARFAVDIAEE
jgi:cytoskeleton protein RodZ